MRMKINQILVKKTRSAAYKKSWTVTETIDFIKYVKQLIQKHRLISMIQTKICSPLPTEVCIKL